MATKRTRKLPYDQLPKRASAAGQNHGAIARAAVDTAALAVRDTVANVVAPSVVAGAKYTVGFVRNFFASK